MQSYLCIWKNKHDWQHQHPFCYISWWRDQKLGPPKLRVEPVTVGNLIFVCVESDHRANSCYFFSKVHCSFSFSPKSLHVQRFLFVSHSHPESLDTRLGNAPFKKWLKNTDDCDTRLQGYSQCRKTGLRLQAQAGLELRSRKNHNLCHTSKLPNRMHKSAVV